MPLPMYWNLVAGSIAGVSELLVMYPLDVAKTRLQLQTTTTGPDAYTSIGDVFRKIVRQEGPRALYRGILPPILVEAPKRAIKFSANDAYKRAFQEKFGIPSSTLLSIATGVSAGITEAFIVGPPELLKIKLQDKRNAGKYSGASDVVRQIVRAEGYLGLTRGLEATIWRHALWNGGYFGVIQSVRSALPEPETHQGALLKNFIAGT
ncbi:mitochondrial carrier, partial [Caulochytrium protostelioides]